MNFYNWINLWLYRIAAAMSLSNKPLKVLTVFIDTMWANSGKNTLSHLVCHFKHFIYSKIKCVF